MRLNERWCWCDNCFISALHVINSALQLNALFDYELKVDMLVSDLLFQFLDQCGL